MASSITLCRGRAAMPSRLPQLCLTPVVLLVLSVVYPCTASAAQQDASAAFDLDALRARGIDPALAAYFSQAPRFSPGTQRISLFVNDEPRGTVTARFDDKGRLCFDRPLLDRAGLVVPDGWGKVSEPGGAQTPALPACADYREANPQTEVELDPGRNAVRLVVPAQALRADAPVAGRYASGGVGGLLNYNLIGMTTQGGGAGQYLYGDGEIGINAGDWIIRSRHSYTSQDGAASISHLYTYAQKTFAERKAMVQAGQINVSGSLFPVPSLVGAQYLPDEALVPQAAGPSFDGIADTQSRVEVRQLGTLIYSTVVPAGPFTLSNLPLLSAAADVEITVVGMEGQTRRYSVPAASLSVGARAPQGLTAAVGQVRDISGSGTRTPLVATVSRGWAIGRRYRVAGGGLVASQYQAAAASLDATIASNIAANLQASVSNAQRESVRGVSLSAGLNARLDESLSVSVTATQQSAGYRSLSDTLGLAMPNANAARFRGQYTASANWQHPLLGGFALSYSRGATYNGASTQYAVLGWSRKVGAATVSLNLEKDLSPQSSQRIGGNGSFRFYAMVSMPLGKGSVQGYSSNAGGQTRFGAGVSQTVNEYLGYTARAETNPTGDGPNASGSVMVMPRYARASLSYAQSGANSRSFTGQLQGGVVGTREGVVFSPYAIGDTFGVVSAGDLSGVRITTPQGSVWTDARGYAVIPALPAYKRARIEVQGKSLPRNTDLNNGIEFVDAGRGSVNFVGFGVVKVRRLLLRVASTGGDALPSALAILNDKGEYVTTSVGEGNVFLDNASEAKLYAKLTNGQRCRIDYAMPDKPNLDRPFDVADAVCNPE